jgi:DDE family transposase
MAGTLGKTGQKKKASTVRHTRAIQRDRSKRPTITPPVGEIEARLTEVIHPATYAQVAAYHADGLRTRILTLPVMVALVLSMLWRQIGSVSEAVRVLRAEGLLWVAPLAVSQQAVSQRLRTLPPTLFARVLQDVLPSMQARFAARERPLPPEVVRARRHFTAILALDGSTLDTVLRHVGLLREHAVAPLAGRMAALLDVATRLPHQLWYEEEGRAADQRFWAPALATLTAGTLLLFDRGFLDYATFDQLTERHIGFITRPTKNMAMRVERTLRHDASVRDRLVAVGSTKDSRCVHPLRLVEVSYRGTWYRYLTNVLDPTVLSAEDVAALYRQRWRIEDAFAVVKRLLGLAYFWVGSANGIKTQVWATWLLYAVLVDLTDEVAAHLGQPFAAVSLEMVYRGLYHFTQAFHAGTATDPVAYLAANAPWLGILKQRRPRASPHLTLALEA